MMDEASKSRLLEEFRQYLDDLDASPSAGEASSGQVDLFSLFSELAALRTEVKTESRLFRSTLDDLRQVQTWLRDNQAGLEQSVEKFSGELPTLRRAVLRPLLLDLLDVHDRLSAGAGALGHYTPVKGWAGVKSRAEDRRFIDSIREGQGMTLRRLEELLARQQVRAMEVLGKPVDPHTMKVVELDREADAAGRSGVVTGEVRRGFWWGDEVLRLAEVRAVG
ncbi:nucleotide exchange factor GrpE [Methylomagnum sp.]